MKVFTCTNFTGHFPVGSAAVIVAPNMKVARQLLSMALDEDGLHLDDTDELIEVSTNKRYCEILLNGDY